MTDAATENVKLITELSGTTQFLKHLGLLYDSFGITCKKTFAQHITLQQLVQKMNEKKTYLKATVSKVKEDNNLKETATTNDHKWSSGHSVTENATVCSASFERS